MTHGPCGRNAPPANRAYAEILRKFSAPADLREKAPDGRQRCLACAHKCVIAPGAYGICGSRFNEAGVLRAPWGYVSSAGLDPMEKKPFFHVLPGSGAFSFGTTGCNFKCGFCQNSGLSRTDRELDRAADIFPADAGTLAAAARDSGAAFMVSTYNEPLISAEWGVAVMKEAGKYGIRGGFVSNAYASEEVLEYIRPWVRIYKADLKTFSAENYSGVIGGGLKGVLKGIEAVHAGGFWLEIVTLFIPGFNDSRKEMEEIAGYIAGLSRDIPWHVTAFHPTYRMTDRGATPASTLLAACEAGAGKGLNYVYAGNIPEARRQDTLCAGCGTVLVRRRGFSVLEDRIEVSEEGRGSCPDCRKAVPGLWK